MRLDWDQAIRRAGDLARKADGAKDLLLFYCRLLQAQKEIYTHLKAHARWHPSGELKLDLPVLRERVSALLLVMASSGSELLEREAKGLAKQTPAQLDEILSAQWHKSADPRFLAKALLQPYARYMAETGVKPVGRTAEAFPTGENSCPFCRGKAQVSFLATSQDQEGGRHLLCSSCLSTWAFRRVVCANCGEEDPSKLGYFKSDQYDHVRIESCDTCKSYIKGIDLTRLGIAVPLVDEVASAALDLWARDQGYAKIELNLVGL
ncbi:MAG TPA: formate dehydrogenase accessory protein FdhE [Blastocatellia bacterium]|nr:formate dehydrogenase accessory protein FdhE [Blastocatellia bacterium]